MNKAYLIYIFIGLSGLLGYRFYRSQVAERHQIALRVCTAKLQELRRESKEIKPVNLYPLKINGKWGYKNGKGKIIVPPKFERAELFSEGRARVIDRNWFQSFIDRQGELVISQKYRGVTDFAGGVAYFAGTQDEPHRSGFIDRDGNIILELKGVNARIETFDYSGFQDGRIAAYLDKQESVPWGFLMPYGNPIPRVRGFVDCTGKESYDEFVWTPF